MVIALEAAEVKKKGGDQGTVEEGRKGSEVGHAKSFGKVLLRRPSHLLTYDSRSRFNKSRRRSDARVNQF